jgi:hypothetical protein
VARKERELERKQKIFALYVKKSEAESAEKVEKEMTNLEEEISKLRLERESIQAQVQILPKQK